MWIEYNEKLLLVHTPHPSIHPACMVCWWVLVSFGLEFGVGL